MSEELNLSSSVAGQPVGGGEFLAVRNPYNGAPVGRVRMAGREDVERAIAAALGAGPVPSRHERSQVLERVRSSLEARREEFARLMSTESGLCLFETRYEVGRALDVLRFSAMEALRDDGQIFSADVSAQGKARKIFTVRDPLRLSVAITPFNHPLNQVAHKICPALAAGARIILKPSEKTPLTAVRFCELFFEAGLPAGMLSVLLGPTDQVAGPLVVDERVELVSFTGSVAVGKKIAATAGYKRVVLELGGNDPLIVFGDADLDLAARLAAEGSFRNSGQRCTAIKRIFVHESIARDFTTRLLQNTASYVCGDPLDEATRVGTVIDEAAAIYLEKVVRDAVADGAKILCGGQRRGAQIEPTVLTDVSPKSRMVACESFGPLAPVMTFADIDEVIGLANGTDYGLSSGVVTSNLNTALRMVRELRCGTVNVNEVPGFRTENSPFGGIKDSGLGIKEGVAEAMKLFTTVKTFSLPW